MRARDVVGPAALALVLLGSAACGGPDEGPGGADCVGDPAGQPVRRGVDGSLEDGTGLRVSFLTTEGGEDGAYVRWAPGAGDEPSADPARVGIGDTFDLGGTRYTLAAVCEGVAWVTAG